MAIFSTKWVPHTEMPVMEEPITVEYCPHCGGPGDFCDYGPKFDKCKPWVLVNCPEAYPQLAGLTLDEATEGAAKKDQETKAKEDAKVLPGGKKKKEATKRVLIKTLSRGRRKAITVVQGLDTFDVKLADVAKAGKKKFACGCSVVKGGPGVPEVIEIQGDFEDEVVDWCIEAWKIPDDDIYIGEGGTKKGGKKK